jgi:hypothetical protein
MSFADVLYGVTMAEKGASSLVSVDLHQTNAAKEEMVNTSRSDHSEPAPQVKDLDLETDRWADIEPLPESEVEELHSTSQANGKNGSAHKAEKTNGGPAHLKIQSELSGEGKSEETESVSEKSIQPS